MKWDAVRSVASLWLGGLLMLGGCGGGLEESGPPPAGEPLGAHEAALCSGLSVSSLSLSGVSTWQGEMAGSGRWAVAGGANAIRLGSDFFHEPIDSQRWRWREVGAELELPSPALSAPSQRANAATAIAALRALPGETLPDEVFAEGVARATLRGRLQQLVHDGVEVVQDVGHNPQAARELASWLQARPIAGQTRVVFAALAARIDTARDELIEQIVGQIPAEKRLVERARSHRDDPGPSA